ncbi:MAG TPA: pentapeptide repeat-containing protein, partial [Thiolapillus brandeum]|nr:pentapeptide repeat-containing protein [Thiolapillus brandeum]
MKILLFISLLPVITSAWSASPGTPKRGNCDKPMPETDLRHCSFAGKRIDGLDIQGAVLNGVDFSNARLNGCNLSGASLKEANLKWAFLTDCTIRKADFLEAELFHTTFDGSVLDG